MSTPDTSLNRRFALLGAKTGNCLRVAVALEALGIPYDQIKVDLRAGEQRQAEFLALNPFGRVPVLLDRAGGPFPSVLTQSNAILLALCDMQPGTLLPAEGDPTRPRVLERFLYFVTDVISIGTGSFYLSAGKQAEGAELLMGRALDAIAKSERFLVPGPYMAGPRFTLADIAAVTVINAYAERISWKELPVLRAWFDFVMAREDVLRGLAAFSTTR
jgi:GST-like protein